jgi:lipopolysaccharide export system permease protein
MAAAIVMSLTYLCGLYLMPTGQRAMKDKVLDIRADIGAALLNEGEFNTPARGLTVFIREIDSDGAARGILIHDARNPKRPITYLAERGMLAQTQAGARLIMFDGTVEQSARGGAQLSMLKFASYVFDLDQFSGPRGAVSRATSERYLTELFWPQDGPKLTPRIRNAYIAEGHSRLSQPLYCIAFAFIALAAMLHGRRARGAYALAITVAVVLAALLRVAGYGVQGIATRYPQIDFLFYLFPLAGTVSGYLWLIGFDPRALISSSLRTEPA